MSTIHVSAQALSYLYASISCGIAVCALLVYDWLLCLDQEFRLIWNWRSVVTIPSLLYAISRYLMLIYSLMSVVTIYPMSDLSCKADVWAQTAIEIFCLITFSAFSALRAYALSNRNAWLATIIILLALPPTAMRIIQSFYQAPENLPSPLNCGSSGSLSLKLSTSVIVVTRGSQFAAELLAVGITWWYTYRSYRIRKEVNLGKPISSLLVYNGSMYFLSLATLYILDIILTRDSVPAKVRDAAAFMETFVDPITSILTCHFMLSLREFDSATRDSATASRHMASTVLQFGAQPSDSLPSFIASFAHPVHSIEMAALSEKDADAPVDDGPEWREMEVVAPILETPSCSSTAPAGPDEPSKLEHSV